MANIIKYTTENLTATISGLADGHHASSYTFYCEDPNIWPGGGNEVISISQNSYSEILCEQIPGNTANWIDYVQGTPPPNANCIPSKTVKLSSYVLFETGLKSNITSSYVELRQSAEAYFLTYDNILTHSYGNIGNIFVGDTDILTYSFTYYPYNETCHLNYNYINMAIGTYGYGDIKNKFSIHAYEGSTIGRYSVPVEIYPESNTLNSYDKCSINICNPITDIVSYSTDIICNCYLDEHNTTAYYNNYIYENFSHSYWNTVNTHYGTQAYVYVLPNHNINLYYWYKATYSINCPIGGFDDVYAYNEYIKIDCVFHGGNEIELKNDSIGLTYNLDMYHDNDPISITFYNYDFYYSYYLKFKSGTSNSCYHYIRLHTDYGKASGRGESHPSSYLNIDTSIYFIVVVPNVMLSSNTVNPGDKVTLTITDGYDLLENIKLENSDGSSIIKTYDTDYDEKPLIDVQVDLIIPSDIEEGTYKFVMYPKHADPFSVPITIKHVYIKVS